MIDFAPHNATIPQERGGQYGPTVDIAKFDASNVQLTSAEVLQTIHTHLQLLPTLDVDVAQDDDGSWTASCGALGVVASGTSAIDAFAQAAIAVAEYWDILNERFDTLSDQLKARLDLRFQPMRLVEKS